MKKVKMITVTLCVACCLAQSAHAQWIVSDPGNLVQGIINASENIVQTTSTAKNMIENVKETVKIYEQGKAYYDALKSVNNLIKDARKVKKTIEMVSEISDIYVRNFQKMLADPNFTPRELEAISFGYARIMEEGGNLVKDLKTIVTDRNGLSMTDKERMDAVDQIHGKMLEYRNVTKYYTDKNISVSFIRAREKNDMQRVLSLYGKPEERYW